MRLGVQRGEIKGSSRSISSENSSHRRRFSAVAETQNSDADHQQNEQTGDHTRRRDDEHQVTSRQSSVIVIHQLF